MTIEQYSNVIFSPNLCHSTEADLKKITFTTKLW